jgi:protein-S-isoprenylcysteine O-methyltransferase Ste14
MADTVAMSSSASAGTATQVLLTASVVCFALSEVSIRVRSSAASSSSTRADHGSIVAVVLTLAVGVLVAAWAADSAPAAAIRNPMVAKGVGVALIGLGIALRQWAVWTLGRYFTVVIRVTADQSVIEKGPYRWVRHPSYTGLLLTLLGLGAALSNWFSVLALVILPVFGIVYRIRVEERELLRRLGESYRRYAARRKRLVPGIW